MSNKKIFKGYDYEGNTLAIIAVKDEETAWVWAAGAELAIHNFREIDFDNGIGVCVLARAHKYDTCTYADTIKERRLDSDTTYVLG